MTRFYAFARSNRLRTTHRLAQTANGSLRFATAKDATLRTFAAADRQRVIDFCNRRGLRLMKWAPIDPYPWLVVDTDTKLPSAYVSRGLNTLAQRAGRKLFINEGERTRARALQLWQDAVQRYGSEAAAARWVARPYTSKHMGGDAADVQDAVTGENLKPLLKRRGLLDDARALGLHFPMDWEPWHIERIR